jgi:hypothetical protein
MPKTDDDRSGEGRIAEALRVPFDSRSVPGFFAKDAQEVLEMIRRKESRIAIVHKLANVQMRACNTVTHDACARLADKLFEAEGQASRN